MSPLDIAPQDSRTFDINIALVLSRYILDFEETYAVCKQKLTENLPSYVNKDGLQLLYDNNSHRSAEHQEKLAFVFSVLNPNNELQVGISYHVAKLMGCPYSSNMDENDM